MMSAFKHEGTAQNDNVTILEPMLARRDECDLRNMISVKRYPSDYMDYPFGRLGDP